MGDGRRAGQLSYDLAVWEGEQPASDAAAAETFARLYAPVIENDEGTRPTSAIAAYVDALLARWPDITTDDSDDSPWSDGPLIANFLVRRMNVACSKETCRCGDRRVLGGDIREVHVADVENRGGERRSQVVALGFAVLALVRPRRA